MCLPCLKTKVDITEDIPKQIIIYFCKGCERYQHAPGQWVIAELESRELLALCLKKLRNMNRVNLVDANFVWTESHSKRIKVKLTVQKEVMGGAILQQTFIVEFVINSMMCEDCHRREAKDFWKAVVQVRQKALHKKTFLYLEQMLIKYQAHDKCLNIKTIHEGLDFFYGRKDDAKKFVVFLQTVVPCRYVTAQQLISHDVHTATYNYKYTYAVEIAPICKDDVVCLPKSTAASLGNIGQLCVVLRVTNQILLIDPFTLKVADLSATNFFRQPFRSLCSINHLCEYTVMDIEYIQDNQNQGSLGPKSQKHLLADVYVVKSSEIGSSAPIHTRTHLGHLLNPGDLVLGFNINNANINEENFEKYEQSQTDKIPDVIIVKKYYGNKAERNRKRKWKLKHLNAMETDSMSNNDNQEQLADFMEDLEEDPMLRQNINIYKDTKKMESTMAVDMDEDGADDDEGCPQITLQEMLDDLVIE